MPVTGSAGHARFGALVRAAISGLPPSSFSMVMATGIVALSSHFLGRALIAGALFGFNIVLYAALWLLTVSRFVFFFRRSLGDLRDHGRAPGYFTLIAATGILGCEFAVQRGDLRTAFVFFVLGLTLWALVFYGVLWALAVTPAEPPREAGLNGLWLVAAVGTESLSVLGVLVAPSDPDGRSALIFLALALFLFGGMLDLIIAALLLHRLLFSRVTAEGLPANLWILMGAGAVTTLAGTTLLAQGPGAPFLIGLEPFVRGLSLLFWATGSAWIPLLIGLGVWKHLVRRVRIKYGPEFWGLVFPLGMYAACTFQLAKAPGLSFLAVIPGAVLFIAYLAWALTFAGLIAHLISAAMSPGGRSSRTGPI